MSNKVQRFTCICIIYVVHLTSSQEIKETWIREKKFSPKLFSTKTSVFRTILTHFITRMLLFLAFLIMPDPVIKCTAFCICFHRLQKHIRLSLYWSEKVLLLSYCKVSCSQLNVCYNIFDNKWHPISTRLSLLESIFIQSFSDVRVRLSKQKPV